VVLNGLDNFMTRQIVADACNKLKIPFVHGAIAGFCGQLDFLDNTYDQILLSFPADQSSPFQSKKVSPNFDSKVEEPKKRTESKVRLV
jgi:molybdopterin/thiamine biosynthesis adenylyltransferase